MTLVSKDVLHALVSPTYNADYASEPDCSTQTHTAPDGIGEWPARPCPIPINRKDVASFQPCLGRKLAFEGHGLGVIVCHDLARVPGLEEGLNSNQLSLSSPTRKTHRRRTLVPYPEEATGTLEPSVPITNERTLTDQTLKHDLTVGISTIVIDDSDDPPRGQILLVWREVTAAL